MAKIRRKPTNIHKVMMLCANWHSLGVKGYVNAFKVAKHSLIPACFFGSQKWQQITFQHKLSFDRYTDISAIAMAT